MPEGAYARLDAAAISTGCRWKALSPNAAQNTMNTVKPGLAILISCAWKKTCIEPAWAEEERVEVVRAFMYGDNTAILWLYSYGEISPHLSWRSANYTIKQWLLQLYRIMNKLLNVSSKTFGKSRPGTWKFSPLLNVIIVWVLYHYEKGPKDDRNVLLNWELKRNDGPKLGPAKKNAKEELKKSA